MKALKGNNFCPRYDYLKDSELKSMTALKA